MDYKIIETKERVLADNDKEAEETRARMQKSGTLLVNLMGSPGAGKTSVLLRIIEALGKKYRIGVMEADVDSDVDAKTVSATGAKVIQLHTGGLCHMDADMTARGLAALDTEGLDIVFLENVGNLVCPAEFEVGADLRIMILSVPEGDDKPLKYPLMFTVSDVMLVNKTDTAPIFDFDFNRACAAARTRNPDIVCIPLSAKTGEGFEPLIGLLKAKIKERRRGQ
ncbi:MAG: hydrogenase nickel incorporation protein HypB [Clostridia bacterium]|nr:hydrogenase nickel incorporation protein HypB [Clostridia bacterium]